MRCSAEIEAERAHLAAIEAIDPAELSDAARFERDIEIHNVRREHLRHRGACGSGSVGRSALDASATALFLLFARDHAPLAERLTRSPAASRPSPTLPRGGAQTGPRVPQVRRWQELEIEAAAEMPGLFDEIVAAGDGVLGRPRAAPARAGRRGGQGRGRALRATWLRGYARRRDATTGRRPRAPRRARRPSRVRRPRRRRDPRARLAEAGRGARPARVAAAREIDPDADEADGRRPDQGRPSGDVRRRRSRPTATSMLRARQHLDRPRPRDRPGRRADRRHRDARVPAQRHPVRGVLRAGEVRPDPKGIYVVTPSVGGRPERDARAQLRLDQQHQHPRGVPGPPPPARRSRRATRR